MLSLRLVTGLLLASSIAACSKTSSSNKSAAANSSGTGAANTAGTTVGPTTTGSATPFLTAADLTPGTTLRALTGEQLIAVLQTDNKIYAHRPGTKTTCYDDVVGAIGPLTATKTGLIIDTTVDFAPCLQQSYSKTPSPNVVYTVTKFPAHVHFIYACASGDLSSLNGKTLKISDTTVLELLCPDITRITEVDSTSVTAVTATGGDGSVVKGTLTSRLVFFSGKADRTGCRHTQTGGVTASTDCVSIERTVTTKALDAAPTTTETYAKKIGTNVKTPADLTTVWYTSGTINIIDGPWTGVLTYSGGKAPTYSLSNKQGAPLTGVLTAVSKDADGASLLDVSSDADHTSVLTDSMAAMRRILRP